MVHFVKKTDLERESQGNPAYVSFFQRHAKVVGMGRLGFEPHVYNAVRRHVDGGGELFASPTRLVIPPPSAEGTIVLAPPARAPVAKAKIDHAERWLTLGPALWLELHGRPAQLSCKGCEGWWLKEFNTRIICGECKAHWIAWLRDNPPDFGSKEAYFRWTVSAHNMVNQRLGKSEASVEDAARAHGFTLGAAE